MPAELSDLGLSSDILATHIAWDPGALEVARGLAEMLNASLVHATVSRLVIDLNRDPSAADSIVTHGEHAPIPGNIALSSAERLRRVQHIYEPFHRSVKQKLDQRLDMKAVISVHSFTPILRGKTRPWHLGFIYDADDRLARHVTAALSKDPQLIVGLNEPYNVSHGVYHTLERHACRRGLAPLMIEIRNDLIRDRASQKAMARRLAPLLAKAVDAL
ncbi:MAG: N-formylglutamate amidohydrolase [Pseudolabrys sp.]|nr:N-formylglutamate amidohydrolase [Pseudolabrys sp.]MBV9260069.1 N-formylglutamate amidohydrolase [Pseudolabrys sp.]